LRTLAALQISIDHRHVEIITKKAALCKKKRQAGMAAEAQVEVVKNELTFL
jgi:hypothetical protein